MICWRKDQQSSKQKLFQLAHLKQQAYIFESAIKNLQKVLLKDKEILMPNLNCNLSNFIISISTAWKVSYDPLP